MKGIELVKKFQLLTSQNKQQEAFELIAQDAVWHSDNIGAPWSGTHYGKENIVKHFSSIKGTTTRFMRKTNQFIEQGDLVVELGSLSCILTKTGKPFDTEYICLYRYKDGKITSYTIFEDSLKLYRAYYGND